MHAGRHLRGERGQRRRYERHHTRAASHGTGLRDRSACVRRGLDRAATFLHWRIEDCETCVAIRWCQEENHQEAGRKEEDDSREEEDDSREEETGNEEAGKEIKKVKTFKT